MITWWKSLPQGLRKVVSTLLKALLTVGAFYLLLTHEVTADGQKIAIASAIRDHLSELDASQLVPYLLLAAFIKFLGISSSMVRWERTSSARSKNSSSTRVAERENRLKFAPPPLRVAPSGWLLPVLIFCFKVLW